MLIWNVDCWVNSSIRYVKFVFSFCVLYYNRPNLLNTHALLVLSLPSFVVLSLQSRGGIDWCIGTFFCRLTAVLVMRDFWSIIRRDSYFFATVTTNHVCSFLLPTVVTISFSCSKRRQYYPWRVYCFDLWNFGTCNSALRRRCYRCFLEYVYLRCFFFKCDRKVFCYWQLCWMRR